MEKNKKDTLQETIELPTTRPAGKNRKEKELNSNLKELILSKLEEDFDVYMEKINQLDDKEYVKIMTDLIKLVVPRARDQEEQQEEQSSQKEYIKRFFSR